jgi:PAS domain S-box-containing protein
MQIFNEHNLSYIVLNAPVGICIVDAATLVVEMVNAHFLKLTGKPEEAVLGKHYREIFPLDRLDQDEMILNKAVQEGRPYTAPEREIPLVHDGEKETVMVSFVYSPIKNNEGSVASLAVWLLENTAHGLNEELAATNEEFAAANEELAAANEELAATNDALIETQTSLQRSEKLFRSIALNIPGSLIIVIDRNHRYVTIEGDIMEKMGFDRQGYEGRHPSEVSPERYEASRHLYERVINGDRFSIEWKTETGEFYIVHFVPLKNEQNEVDAGLIITLDITDIKQAEEKSAKLAAIVQSSDDAIISKTPESVITSWNTAAERIFGYTADEMVGETIYKIIPPDRQDEEPLILARLKKGERVEHFETKRLTKDGHLLDISLTISPIKDARGNIIGLSKIARDITEKKQEEQRKNDFIGMVSHELKTPLTSLSAIIQMGTSKLRNSEDEFLSGAMENANRQVKKMTSMINGFLNISRLESGQLLIEKEPFRLDGLLRETLEETKLTVSSHIFSLNECNDITVNADRDKIGSVISNLISNAVKYSPRGKLIDIRCQTEGKMVVVSVKDEGIGIKASEIDRVFDRYYRVENRDLRHISGFGIGLYLSAEIIKRHDGKIWAESGSGKGSTFYFTLPLA